MAHVELDSGSAARGATAYCAGGQPKAKGRRPKGNKSAFRPVFIHERAVCRKATGNPHSRGSATSCDRTCFGSPSGWRGTAQVAEDVVQEALLRAWRSRESLGRGRCGEALAVDDRAARARAAVRAEAIRDRAGGRTGEQRVAGAGRGGGARGARRAPRDLRARRRLPRAAGDAGAAGIQTDEIARRTRAHPGRRADAAVPGAAEAATNARPGGAARTMIMDCLEFRRAAGADPGHLGAGGCRSSRRLPACAESLRRTLGSSIARILAALQVPVPESARTARPGRMVRFPVIEPRRWMALAASVAGGVLIGSLLWVGGPRASLAGDVVKHVIHEPGAMVATSHEADPAAVEAVLERAGVRLRPGVGPVSYASTCPFRGEKVPHLVVQTAVGPMTVMVLRRRKGERAHGVSTRAVTPERSCRPALAASPSSGTRRRRTSTVSPRRSATPSCGYRGHSAFSGRKKENVPFRGGRLGRQAPFCA